MTHRDPRLPGAEPQAEEPRSPITDEGLLEHFGAHWEGYRSAITTYFPEHTESFLLFAVHLATTVVRMGSNGVIVGHKPAPSPSLRVMHLNEFDPPLEDFNLFTIQARLDVPLIEFDFVTTTYNSNSGPLSGARRAFSEALEYFWLTLPIEQFDALCRDLLREEGVRLTEPPAQDQAWDAVGDVFLDEPGRSVRQEQWAFEMKHHRHHRASAAAISELGDRIQASSDLDVACLLTTTDLTSIGTYVAVSNPRLRVWDRVSLSSLLHRHPTLLARYFQPYASALDLISRSNTASNTGREKAFALALATCPSGNAHYRRYETIGEDLIRYLFPTELGPPQVQSITSDGVERRDIVTRNNRTTRFFQRIASLFAADFVVWDCKNYSDKLNSDTVSDVCTYLNPALGRFAVAISRHGVGETGARMQRRRFSDDNRLVLVLSDEHVIEMVRRKDQGEPPEDVLEDLLDQFLLDH